ncbi:anti-repressor SinI family protein [Alkalihalobacillus sp. BA299]|nr:anti-repressor SinI family protein [Alkalihalobacillus sp. BA299]
MEKNATEKLDQEWVELIKEALDMGMRQEEIRLFLFKKSKNAQGDL